VAVDRVGAAVAEVRDRAGAGEHRRVDRRPVGVVVAEGHDDSGGRAAADEVDAARGLGGDRHRPHAAPRGRLKPLHLRPVRRAHVAGRMSAAEAVVRADVRAFEVVAEDRSLEGGIGGGLRQHGQRLAVGVGRVRDEGGQITRHAHRPQGPGRREHARDRERAGTGREAHARVAVDLVVDEAGADEAVGGIRRQARDPVHGRDHTVANVHRHRPAVERGQAADDEAHGGHGWGCGRHAVDSWCRDR
jgi:hypothetical protein